MKPDQLLNELGLTMGMPNLAFNDEGCARLVFDEKIPVNLERDSDTGLIQIYTDLCPLPPEGREALYLALLEGNLFGRQTVGATLAVDSDQQEVVLCRTVVAEDVSARAFIELIEGFVNCAEQWRETLALHATSAGAPADDQPYARPSDSFIRG